MKALVYHGPQDIRCEEVPDPVLHDGRGAVVRITSAAICGSDLHIYGGHGFSPTTGYTVGHEAIGEVVAVGPDVDRFAVGDRVLVPGSVGCGRCDACSLGITVSCDNLRSEGGCYGLGAPHLGGCQAEAVAVPAADMNLVHQPDGVSDDAALLLTDNGPTGWYGARLGRVGPGDSVAVVGLGPVGAMAVKAALLMGAAQVFAIDLVPERRDRAAAMGAIPIVGDPVAEVRARTRGKGADVAIEAVGSDATISLALSLVGSGGRVGVVGVSQNMAFPFPMALAQVRCIEFAAGLTSVQRELRELLPLCAAGRLRADDVVTHHLALSDGPEAYAMFAARDGGVGKIVLDIA